MGRWLPEANELGRGGVTTVAGAARSTIERGVRELANEDVEVALPVGRSRRAGAGRKRATVADTKLVAAIDALVDDRRSWPSRVVAALDAQVDPTTRGRGDRGGPSGELTHRRPHLGDRPALQLAGDRKSVEGRQHPDRDAQFRYLNEQIPAAVLAELLHLQPTTAVRWVAAAGGDWSTYAARIARNQ